MRIERVVFDDPIVEEAEKRPFVQNRVLKIVKELKAVTSEKACHEYLLRYGGATDAAPVLRKLYGLGLIEREEAKKDSSKNGRPSFLYKERLDGPV